MSPKIVTFWGTLDLLLLKLIENSFYENVMGAETLRMRYRKTYFYI